MIYNVITFSLFDKQLKRLSKKYPSLKTDLAKLGNLLSNEPKQGTSLGLNCYKVRLAISSKGKGKSAGARVITHIHLTEDTVILMSIYDKSEYDTISEAAVKEILKSIYQ